MDEKITHPIDPQSNIFSNTTNYFLLAVALLIAVAFRVYKLNRFSLWADELWGVMACSKGSWISMMQDLVSNDNHPPGYQTILYFVMKWFGDTETIIRSPSIVAGVVTVYAIYCIGQKLLSRETGFLAAFIVACSYQSVFYSQEARAYALLTLFSLINAYYFLELFIVENTNNKNVLIFTATSACCAFLHYAGLLFILCELAILGPIILFSKNKKALLIGAAYSYGILILLYIKWIPVMIAQMHNNEFYWEEKPTIAALIGTLKYLLGPDDLRLVVYSGAIILAVSLAVNAIYKYRNQTGNEHKMILSLFLLASSPLALVFIKSLVSSSVYTNRYFIFIIPLMSLLAAQGFVLAISHFKTNTMRQYGLAATIIFICGAGFLSNRALYIELLGKQDFRGAVKIVSDDSDFKSKSGAVIASHEFFDYYLDKFDVTDHAQGYLLFPNQLPQTIRKIKTLGSNSFYYLEVAADEKTKNNQLLDVNYHRVSYQRVKEINVIKYKVTE